MNARSSSHTFQRNRLLFVVPVLTALGLGLLLTRLDSAGELHAPLVPQFGVFEVLNLFETGILALGVLACAIALRTRSHNMLAVIPVGCLAIAFTFALWSLGSPALGLYDMRIVRIVVVGLLCFWLSCLVSACQAYLWWSGRRRHNERQSPTESEPCERSRR